MGQSINLYFDRVSHEGSHGQTKNGEKILYNLKQISEEYFNKYADMLSDKNKATIFCPTGRFISVITASLDENEKFMVTFDLHDSEPFARYNAHQSEGNSELFMAVFYKIRETYRQDFSKFILVEGEIPVQQAQET